MNELTREKLIDFSAMMDLSFKKFVTVGVIKLLYLIGIVLIGIAVIAMVVMSFAGGAATGILTLIFAPIIFFLWVLFLRIYLEIIIVLFRIAENTSIMAGRGDAFAGAVAPPHASDAPAV
jgi:hypothetical protein